MPSTQPKPILNTSLPPQFRQIQIELAREQHFVLGQAEGVAQLHAHMMSHQYEGLMKKANLRGPGRGGLAR